MAQLCECPYTFTTATGVEILPCAFDSIENCLYPFLEAKMRLVIDRLEVTDLPMATKQCADYFKQEFWTTPDECLTLIGHNQEVLDEMVDFIQGPAGDDDDDDDEDYIKYGYERHYKFDGDIVALFHKFIYVYAIEYTSWWNQGNGGIYELIERKLGVYESEDEGEYDDESDDE
jgi:hypothetical protein